MSKTESGIRCKIVLENICNLYIRICNADILKPKYEKQKSVKDKKQKEARLGFIQEKKVWILSFRQREVIGGV